MLLSTSDFSDLFSFNSPICDSALDKYPLILDWQFLNKNSSLVLAFVDTSWNQSGSSILNDKADLSGKTFTNFKEDLLRIYL